MFKFNELKCTDGSTSSYTLSVFGLYNGTSLISKFSGDSTSAAHIYETFANVTISGYTHSNQYAILNFYNLLAGSYTLSVLAARGSTPSAPISANTYYISTNDNSLTNVTASVIAYNVSEPSREPKLTADGASVSAFVVGSNKTATDWALVEFSFELTNATKVLHLMSESTNGNIAAVKLTTIPEPSTSAFLLITLTALITHRRRK
ncbi:MAG: PEP-CTERM sorting domain-containing protein [Akkermansia sp.]|nr:PEP-CTERM sorting domain-containing protein [Akkermansia sp.]